jgi:hypothetical protein
MKGRALKPARPVLVKRFSAALVGNGCGDEKGQASHGYKGTFLTDTTRSTKDQTKE